MNNKEIKKNNRWIFKTELIDCFAVQKILLPQISDNEYTDECFMQITVVNLIHDNLNKTIRNWMKEKTYKPASFSVLDVSGNCVEKWELSIKPSLFFVEELLYESNADVAMKTVISFKAKVLDIK